MMAEVFHLFVVLLSTFAIWHDQMFVDIPFSSDGYRDMPYKARYIYIEYWCIILQTVYFSLALLNDFFGTQAAAPRKTSIIRFLKDTVFSLAFPIALHVTISFWSIYFVDKELVFPEVISRNFPVWLNHTLHTFITVFILIELVLTNRTYPPRLLGITITAGFAISYIIWLHVLYERNGAWVYPIFAVLTLPQRIIYLGVSLLFGTAFYLLGEKLNSFVCADKSKSYSNGDSKRKRK